MTPALPPTDPMERAVYEALTEAGVPFTNDPRETAGLDFLILTDPVHIEVKQFHSDRIAGQMARADNVIAIQGRQAVAWFSELLRTRSALSVAVAEFLSDVECSDLDDLDYGRWLAKSGIIERLQAAQAPALPLNLAGYDANGGVNQKDAK